MNRESIFERFSAWCARGFSAGYSPVAPGTAGTLLAVIAWYFIPSDILIALAGFTLLAVSVKGMRRIVEKGGDHDPSQVVVDEMIGFFVAGFFHERTLKAALVLFFLFRIFDILKPWPASWANRKKGIAYIVLDDVVAGVYASAVLFLVEYLLK